MSLTEAQRYRKERKGIEKINFRETSGIKHRQLKYMTTKHKFGRILNGVKMF